jgi:hypothetical protein
MNNRLDRGAEQVSRRDSRSLGRAVEETQSDRFDPASWRCLVCGKVRPRELLHSKAILGQQQLVCAPSCLEAERRANAR